MQALVGVQSTTQLILRTQQECTLVQTVLPENERARGDPAEVPEVRRHRGNSLVPAGPWPRLRSLPPGLLWQAVGVAGSTASSTTLVHQSFLNMGARPVQVLACV